MRGIISLILTLVFVLIMLKIIRNSRADGDDSEGRLMENIGRAAREVKEDFEKGFNEKDSVKIDSIKIDSIKTKPL